MLFQWEASGQPAHDVMDAYWGGLSAEIGEPAPEEDRFANSLLEGVSRRVAELDKLIREHAENWRLERMSAVDRNVLRLAIHEMRKLETPPAIAINEAIELGRRYSGDQSARFLNGILDAVRRTLEKTGEIAAAPPSAETPEPPADESKS